MMVTKDYRLLPEEIGYMTISELKPFELKYLKEKKFEAESNSNLIWTQGMYVLQAINASVVGNSQWFSGKHHKFDYPDHPYTEEKKKVELSADKQEEMALAEMKMMMAHTQSLGLPAAPR